MILGIGAIAGTTIFATISTIGFLFWVYNNTNRKCIALPNDLNIDSEAVFNLRNNFFTPNTTAKFADGTPVVDDEIWNIYYTDTTLHGSTMGKRGNEPFQFAWRADTGVVREMDDKNTYDAIVAEAEANGKKLPPWFELLNEWRTYGHRCKTRFIMVA